MESVHQHYKDSFWQGYSFLKENFQKTKLNFSQLNYVFTRLSELHLYYSHGLNQIYNYIIRPSVDVDHDLTYNEAFSKFLEYIKEESVHHRRLSDKTKDLIKKHLDTQIQKIEYCFKADETELKKQQDATMKAPPLSITNSQTHFERIQEHCESSFARLREHETKYFDQLSKALKEMLRHKEYNNIEKIEKDMKIDQARQEYKDVINKTVITQTEYIKKFIAHADEYENIDKIYIDSVRTSILEYSSIVNKYLADRQLKLNETIIPKVNEINVENDINNFILKHETFGLPPSNVTFENYSVNRTNVPEAEPRKDDPNRKAIIDGVHNFVLYFSETEHEQKQFREEVKDYFDKANNGVLTEDELNQLGQLFEKEGNGTNYQTAFLSYLNDRRTGEKEISVESFQAFSNILRRIMELSQQDSVDFTTRYKVCNWCFVLSETFYIKDENDQDMYMITEINKTGVFDKVDWVCFFKYILLDNLSSRGNYRNYKFQLTKQEMDISREFETKIFTLAQNLKFLNRTQDNIVELIQILYKKYHQKEESFERIKEQLPIFLN